LGIQKGDQQGKEGPPIAGGADAILPDVLLLSDLHKHDDLVFINNDLDMGIFKLIPRKGKGAKSWVTGISASSSVLF
jgi:hypothetical protein